MRILFYMLILACLISSCRKGEDLNPDFYACSLDFNDSSYRNPNAAKYQALLDGMTDSGVVGVTMSVYTAKYGLWLGTGGKADLHNNIAFQPCIITRGGSTVKMFTATVVLLLQEEGKVSLDRRISDYLDAGILSGIENAGEATVRQLLQHSSGIYNYIQNLKFQTASLNDLIRSWQAADLLEYARNKPAYFKPGEDVLYSNTNYILLGLLIEQVEQKPLFRVFNEKIFQPLGLAHTEFAGENPVPVGIARGYIDIYSNLDVIETTYFSGWDYYTADGGLISTPYDMSRFFRALMGGKVISQASLGEMLNWKAPNEQNPDFFISEYGLGIFRIGTDRGIAYYHSGDAIGYYANMMYFPADGTTVVYAVNSNYGEIDQYVSTMGAMQKVINATVE